MFTKTFKALSDPTRRQILELLKKNGRMSAGDIVSKFDMTGATISHHLSILKKSDLISDIKQGKFIYYEINLSLFEEVLKWINNFIGGINNEK